ncbi:MAG: YbhB/YbcL family Raf kinase inhibitor-like protein [Ignavibacteriales bacterium]|nr:YbhB/YbcL family Raf kinase inhibitor-like protein [Ignavibacteriales bacterium]
MKSTIFILIVFLCAFTTALGQTFTLKSNDVGGQATEKQVFNGFGCSGANVSPQLRWENPPAGTKSFAVTMYDPDAPTGSGWWHWLMFDIPASAKELPSNAGDPKSNLAPKGSIQSVTDFGAAGYGGPCPPPRHGSHQYIITVYALKVDKLGPDEKAQPAMVGYNIRANTIQKASIVMYYGR